MAFSGGFLRNFPVTPTPSIFSKTLPYKWEPYCSTNGWCTAIQMGGILLGFPFFKAYLEARKVQRYKWGAYCRTNWRCTAVVSSRPVWVGVSDTLLIVLSLATRTKKGTRGKVYEGQPPSTKIKVVMSKVVCSGLLRQDW